MKKRLQELTDEELMVLYQQGQDDAFNLLYQRYADRVYGYLRQRMRDPQAANDVFQAALMKLHRSKGQFNSTFAFAPWLFAVVRTALLDWQKDSRNKVVQVEFQEESFIPSQVSPFPDIGKEDLAGLPETQKAALELRYFNDLSFDEIASKLDTTPENVRKLVSRGIQNLRALFNKAGG